MGEAPLVAVIRGDGIGGDVTDATLAVVAAALKQAGAPDVRYDDITAGAALFAETGLDIEADGETRAGAADAIFLGAIGLPSVRHEDGTEISPHLRLRDRFQLYAGVRPVRAYPNAPQRLADERAAGLDLVIIRESTEGLFYTAAVHDRSPVEGDPAAPDAVSDIMRISGTTTRKLHDFAFRLAARRKARGRPGRLTCVDKANVFRSQAFFRALFDEVAARHPERNRREVLLRAQRARSRRRASPRRGRRSQAAAARRVEAGSRQEPSIASRGERGRRVGCRPGSTRSSAGARWCLPGGWAP